MNRSVVAVVVIVLALGVLAGRSDGARRNAVERGRYLALTMGCNECHTPKRMTPQGPQLDSARLLSGHPQGGQLPSMVLPRGPWAVAGTADGTAWIGPWGISYATNLTPDNNTGLGLWSEAMFLSALRTGKHMGTGRPILPPMPWQDIAALNDDDLRALYAYLRSLPAISNPVPSPVLVHGRRSNL